MGMQIVVPEHEGFVVAGARGQPIRGLVFRCADAFAREAELIEDRHPHEGLQAAHPPARVGDKLEREIVFGGNPLAMAAGVATARMIENENLLENCRVMSDRFRTHFEKLKEELPIISDLRIRGMMIGIDLTIPSTPAVEMCMEKGVLVNATHETVLRLLPSLNITAEQVDEGCAVIADVLHEMAEEV